MLSKLSAADPNMGLYVQIGTGQLHGISATVNDDGSNILLISKNQCSRMGATIYHDSSPLLKGLDGEMRNYIIGLYRTSKAHPGQRHTLSSHSGCALYVGSGR